MRIREVYALKFPLQFSHDEKYCGVKVSWAAFGGQRSSLVRIGGTAQEAGKARLSNVRPTGRALIVRGNQVASSGRSSRPVLRSCRGCVRRRLPARIGRPAAWLPDGQESSPFPRYKGWFRPFHSPILGKSSVARHHKGACPITGTKRTFTFAKLMSAFDPWPTSTLHQTVTPRSEAHQAPRPLRCKLSALLVNSLVVSLWQSGSTQRIHIPVD